MRILGFPGIYLSICRAMSLAVISVPPPAEDPTKRVSVFPSKKFLPDWAAAEAARKSSIRNAFDRRRIA